MPLSCFGIISLLYSSSLAISFWSSRTHNAHAHTALIITLQARHEPTYSSTAIPSPKHLFFFSALTFNAHSIHIDPLYTRSVERHRGLLVHGPLTLALMLRELRGTAARITYRNFAPLYVGEPLRVCVREAEEEGRPWDVWVEGPDGGMAVKGTAVMER